MRDFFYLYALDFTFKSLVESIFIVALLSLVTMTIMFGLVYIIYKLFNRKAN